MTQYVTLIEYIRVISSFNMQDRAITAIGKLELVSKKELEPYQLYVENMFPGQDYYMLLAVFQIHTDSETQEISVQFLRADLDLVSELNYEQFLYRKGSARGGDITFTTKAGDIDKKLKTFVKQLKQSTALADAEGLSADKKMLLALDRYLDAQFAIVKQTLKDEFANLDKKTQQKCGFSLKFIQDGKEKYLRDYQVFKTQILNHGIEGKFSKYSVQSKSEHHICSICHSRKEVIYGFASPFKYATVDKPGFVSGFFIQKTNWKNYPICSECAIEFELGQKVVNTNLRKSFYGTSYFMIPKPVISGDFSALQMVLRKITQLDYEKAAWLKSGESGFIQSKEDYMMRKLGEEANSFSVSLLFFDENPTTKAINIILMLEEIFPSTFRKIFIDIPEQINAYHGYKDQIKIKKQFHDLQFNFGILKAFFPNQFYDMIHKVFRQEAIQKEFLWQKFMDLIRSNYNKAKSNQGYVESGFLTVLKAHLLFRYFARLGMITTHSTNSIMIEENLNEEKKESKKSFDTEKFNAFIAENRNFLDEDYKAGIFAVGVLVKFLLNQQFYNLRNTPFENKLKGLNLNHESIKSIYVEALEKLSQYNKGFFVSVHTDLRNFINQTFTINSHKISKLSNNEISFYFVAGLEFGNKFKTKSQTENPDNHE